MQITGNLFTMNILKVLPHFIAYKFILEQVKRTPYKLST